MLNNELEWISNLFLKGRAQKLYSNFDLKDDAAIINIGNIISEKGLSSKLSDTPKISDKRIIITQDTIVEGVHFFKGTEPKYIAKKVFRANVSDIIAKGGEPFLFLQSLSLSEKYKGDFDWLSKFSQSLFDDAEKYNCEILGGDTTSINEGLVITITMLGLTDENMILRSSAKNNDGVYVTGEIGSAAMGYLLYSILNGYEDEAFKLIAPNFMANDKLPEFKRYILALDDKAIDELITAFLSPELPWHERKIIKKYANASIDISDGLLGDLQKVLMQSDVGISWIDSNKIPMHEYVRRVINDWPELLLFALTFGDDYQTLFTVKNEHQSELIAELRNNNDENIMKITKIAEINDEKYCDERFMNKIASSLDSNLNTISKIKLNYDHVIS